VCIDVLAVDGFGALHPRGAGAATQLGVQARLPCIGVGKSLSGACSLREKEVLAAMDNCAALQLDVSAHCAANSTTGSVAATSCGMSCVAVRKTLASRRPVYITVNPPPQTTSPTAYHLKGRPHVQHRYCRHCYQWLPCLHPA
jgi:deoxyinosine 3'endonuclease (endonuclease V)